MGNRLAGMVAVVTGAGRGIGRSIAIALSQEGANLVVNDLGGALDGISNPSRAPADEVAGEIVANYGKAVANYDSVASPEGARNIIETAIKNFGKVDILVNNAGNRNPGLVSEMTIEQWDSVLKVHLYGTFYCTKYASAFMKQQSSGRIINITSAQAWRGFAGAVNYVSAKAGVYGFTRGCASELSSFGITVNCISPNATTRLGLAASGKKQDIDFKDPGDVAPLIVFLSTHEAAGINGQCFGIKKGEVYIYSTPAPVKYIYKSGRWTVDELIHIVPSTLVVPEKGKGK